MQVLTFNCVFSFKTPYYQQDCFKLNQIFQLFISGCGYPSNSIYYKTFFVYSGLLWEPARLSDGPSLQLLCFVENIFTQQAIVSVNWHWQASRVVALSLHSYTVQRKQRDFQSREPCSVLIAERPGAQWGLWASLNHNWVWNSDLK